MQTSLYRKTSWLAIALFWLLMTGMLIERHYHPLTWPLLTLHKAVLPPESFEEQWMGVYLKGEKIGYLSRKISPSEGGYIMDEAFQIRIKVMGAEKQIETLLRADLAPDLKLLSFSAKIKGDLDMEISGTVAGKELTLTIGSSGVRSTKVLKLAEAPMLEGSALSELLRNYGSGNSVSIPVFDPTLMSVEDLRLRISSREKIMSLGKLREAYKVEGELKGVEFTVWATDKGEILREESPMGFVLVKESKDDAIRSGQASPDLVANAAVPFNMKLPAQVSYLKLRISGIAFRGLELDGGRQRLTGDILEIRREVTGERAGKQPANTPDQTFVEFLKETIFIQSKDPGITGLAKEIVGGEKDPLASARLIYEWVYRNIEKVPTITIPMATDVLRTKKGDCNEHTTLFVALARAAGIPAKIAVGLTFKNGVFYYHAWPEFYAGQWIAADPTLGQFPADAAHIRLVTGDLDRQIQILPVINRIKLEGLEYR